MPHRGVLDRIVARHAIEELMARFTRAVDALAFDDLADVLRPDVTIRYSWLAFGADTYSDRRLSGLPAVQHWLRERLIGRPELRRFVGDLELEAVWASGPIRCSRSPQSSRSAGWSTGRRWTECDLGGASRTSE